MFFVCASCVRYRQTPQVCQPHCARQRFSNQFCDDLSIVSSNEISQHLAPSVCFPVRERNRFGVRSKICGSVAISGTKACLFVDNLHSGFCFGSALSSHPVSYVRKVGTFAVPSRERSIRNSERFLKARDQVNVRHLVISSSLEICTSS